MQISQGIPWIPLEIILQKSNHVNLHLLPMIFILVLLDIFLVESEEAGDLGG